MMSIRQSRKGDGARRRNEGRQHCNEWHAEFLVLRHGQHRTLKEA